MFIFEELEILNPAHDLQQLKSRQENGRDKNNKKSVTSNCIHNCERG